MAACVTLLGPLAPAMPGVQAYEGRRVVSIAYEPELQPLAGAELADLMPLHAGDTFSTAAVRGAIERLYATGRYREIAVDARGEDGGVALRFITRPSWFLGRIEVTGVKEPPNRGQLVSATKLQLGSEFRVEDLQSAVDLLRAKLEANGYFEARIDPEVRYEEATSQAHIEFRVDSGPRARLTQPDVRGLDRALVPEFVRKTRWRRLGGLLGWKRVSENLVSRGLENVRKHYAKREHLLNQVSLESLDYDPKEQQARPVVTVRLGPKAGIQVVGAKISRGRLRQLVPVFREQSVDRDLLMEGQRNVAEYFQSRGYFRVAVNLESRQERDGRQVVVYRVERGERYKLVRLSITGHAYFSDETIRERLESAASTRLRYRWGRFSDSMLRSDLDSIRELYQSNGFRDLHLESSVEENVQGRKNHLAVTIRIGEGPQWLVGRHELAGVREEHQADVEPLISSSAGQPFSESSLATDRDNVLNYYYNRGYPEASFEWTVTPAPEPNHVNVKLSVTEGPRQFVRGFVIGGLRTSDPDMVFERIRLSEGDPLSHPRMVESQRRLYDLGVFARVDMAVQNPDGAEARKYLLYQFEEARKYSVNFGIGAEIARIGGGTPNFDAPAGEAGFSPRVTFGISRTNFAGAGHTAGFQSRLSNIQQRLLGTYVAPQFKGKERVALTASILFDLSRDIRTFEGRRLEGSLQLSQKLSLANTLQTRFTYRRNTVHNLAIESALVPIYSRPVRVGLISMTLFQDYRDDPIDSHRGYYNSIDFGFASRIFASGTEYFRLLARNSTYHRVYKDILFARSTAMGYLQNLRGGQGGPAGIPLPERYFSGGAATHRGFPDNQAGPRDRVTGFPLGGSALLMNNFELRFPLLGEGLGGVLFHDSGNVYSGIRDLSFRVRQRDLQDFDYMVHSIGLGFRYRTPVGPVRVDFGFGLNSPRFQFERRTDLPPGSPAVLVTQRINRFQFHFSLGQSF